MFRKQSTTSLHRSSQPLKSTKSQKKIGKVENSIDLYFSNLIKSPRQRAQNKKERRRKREENGNSSKIQLEIGIQEKDIEHKKSSKSPSPQQNLQNIWNASIQTPPILVLNWIELPYQKKKTISPPVEDQPEARIHKKETGLFQVSPPLDNESGQNQLDETTLSSTGVTEDLTSITDVDQIQPEQTTISSNRTITILAYDKKSFFHQAVYNMENKSLKFVKSIPIMSFIAYEILPQFIHHPLENQTYMTGGKSKDTFLKNVTKLQDKDGMIQVSKMLVPRADHGIAHLNRHIYVAGGINDKGLLNDVEVYNTVYNQWTSITPLSERKVGLTLSSANGHLYCIGGWNGYHILDTVECYYPDMMTWNWIQILPSVCCNACAGEVNERLYVLGGRDKIGSNNDLYVYDEQKDHWITDMVNQPVDNTDSAIFFWKHNLYCINLNRCQLSQISNSKLKEESVIEDYTFEGYNTGYKKTLFCVY